VEARVSIVYKNCTPTSSPRHHPLHSKQITYTACPVYSSLIKYCMKGCEGVTGQGLPYTFKWFALFSTWTIQRHHCAARYKAPRRRLFLYKLIANRLIKKKKKTPPFCKEPVLSLAFSQNRLIVSDQPGPAHSFTTSFVKHQFNIILPITHTYSTCYLPFSFLYSVQRRNFPSPLSAKHPPYNPLPPTDISR